MELGSIFLKQHGRRWGLDCVDVYCHCSVERVVDDVGAPALWNKAHSTNKNTLEGGGITLVCWIREELHFMDKASALTNTKASNVEEFRCSIKTKHNQKWDHLCSFPKHDISTVPTANLKFESMSQHQFHRLSKTSPLGGLFVFLVRYGCTWWPCYLSSTSILAPISPLPAG